MNTMKAERFVLIGISALACSWVLFALSGLTWILSFPARLGHMPLSNLPLLACLDLIRLQLNYPSELLELPGGTQALFVLFVGLVPLLIWGLSVRLILRSSQVKRLLPLGLIILVALLSGVTVAWNNTADIVRGVLIRCSQCISPATR
jgi:hypothetical protein